MASPPWRAWAVVLALGFLTARSVPTAPVPGNFVEALVRGENCDGDAQWIGVKHRLHHLLARVAEGARIDVPRVVNMLTGGVGSEDLLRCPVGAAAVQLFLQYTLALTDASLALELLRKEPWPITQEPWADLSAAPWPTLVASTWPFFEVLDAMRFLFLEAATPPHEMQACQALWERLPEEHRIAASAADDVGFTAGLAIALPSGACAAARASAALALLGAMASGASAEVKSSLLLRAQAEATEAWPLELLQSPWPALQLLREAARRQGGSEAAGLELGGELRGAIVIVHFRPGEMVRLHNLETTLESLQRFWLDKVPASWPVVIFADAASAGAQEEALRKRFPGLDLRVAVMSERDLGFPMNFDHPSCSQGYRRAARFSAGPLYMHPALDEFTHVLVLDTEFELTHPVPWDPLQDIFAQGVQLGYWQTHYESSWNRTVFLTEISREFMRANGLKPQVPELVQYWWDFDEVPGGSLPVNIYGCLFAGSMGFFRSELFQAYFQALDQFTGWDEFCWSPQSVLAIAAAFFLTDPELSELWVYGRHQKASKSPKDGWNDSRKGLIPAGQRPEDLAMP